MVDGQRTGKQRVCELANTRYERTTYVRTRAHRHSRRSRYALRLVRSTHAEPGRVMSAPAGAMAAEQRGLEFPAFPFPPYAIQNDLMRHIYATLDAGGVGVFESPTGTVRRFVGACESDRACACKATHALALTARAVAVRAGQNAEPAVRCPDVAAGRAGGCGRASAPCSRRRRRCAPPGSLAPAHAAAHGVTAVVSRLRASFCRYVSDGVLTSLTLVCAHRA